MTTSLLFIAIIFILAVGFVLWRKLDKFHETSNEQWLPAIEQVSVTCRQQDKIATSLDIIIAELTPDSGLSLRDAVNRVEAATQEQYKAAEFLKDGVRSDRHKAELDREQLQRLLVEMFRLTIKVEDALKSLALIQVAADGVADDLAQAHQRADNVTDGDHGAAADAASRQTPQEKLANKEREAD